MNADEWTPSGRIVLESAADRAVRQLEDNLLVLAGPGAGKTELLAQKACFLLQTGACPAPRRILAISFKRDAARNLRERVATRCGRDLSSRFDSYTFDAFGKGLVDRFRAAIPDHVRPNAGYRVLVDLGHKRLAAFLRDLPDDESQLGAMERATLGTEKFYKDSFLSQLQPDGWKDGDIAQRATHELWDYLVKHGGSALSFPMIGRLGELVLRTNPLIAEALRSTYSFVFMDEFQDTTEVNYDLICAAFQGSAARLTAVGDNKQRVMGWAGAYKSIFSAYHRDFAAPPTRLSSNYRSVRKLVLIQNIIAKALDAHAVEMAAMGPRGQDGGGDCRVLLFSNEQQEARWLADCLCGLVECGIPPREICVLARMKTAKYTASLQAALAMRNVKSRVEDQFQDLLAEPLSEVLLAFLKLSCRAAAPEAWTRVNETLELLLSSDDERQRRRRVDAAVAFCRQLQDALEQTKPAAGAARAFFLQILGFIGESQFRQIFPQYLQDEWYEEQLTALAEAFADGAESWSGAIDNLEGVDTIPLMTIHKSKGLEYHTVVLLGLEDAAHWGYRSNAHEETCTFFVALSRAKCTMLFTYAAKRDGDPQRRNEIRKLYEMLESAGVAVEAVADHAASS